ncbi:MAG: YceD family protein [Gallionella sp.]
MSARPFIDSLDFARNGSEMNGVVHAADMPRLLEITANPEGDVSYTIRGVEDAYGVSFLDITLDGSCQLICQRCLKAMNHLVKIDTKLFLRNQVELDALEDEEDEFDSILAEAELVVLSVLEEEILLSLPIAPKHESGACEANAVLEGLKEENNPFATLASLKVVN